MSICMWITFLVLLIGIAYAEAPTGDRISFNYHLLDINETYANIVWNPLKGCTGNVTYKLLRALRGNVINDSDTCDIPESSYSINKAMLEVTPDSRFKYYVNACCDGVEYSSDVSLEIPPEVITLEKPTRPGTDVCLQPGSSALTVIWPKSNNTANGTCVCSQWFRINRCDCIAEENFYGVYNRRESAGLQICWKNINNHTRIHFVIESLNPLDVDNPLPFPNINQEFLESYDLVFSENSSPPNVSIQVDEGRISLCYFNGNDDDSLISHYFVTLSDNTGFRSSFTVNKTVDGCYSIPVNNQRLVRTECSPLSAAVQDVNGNKLSDPFMIFFDGELADKCACFKSNVKILLGFEQSSIQNKFIIDITCETLYEDFNATNVFLDINESDKTMFHTEVYCSSSILETPILNSGGVITARISWTPDENTECLQQIENVPIAISRSQTPVVVYVVSIVISTITVIVAIVPAMVILLYHSKKMPKHIQFKTTR